MINGSGLREILGTNELSIIGTSVAVDVNDIKCAGYCLQVEASAIYRKLKDAHKNSNTALQLTQWLENHILESQMSYYWKTILIFKFWFSSTSVQPYTCRFPNFGSRLHLFVRGTFMSMLKISY